MRQLKISKQITNRESQSLDKYLQEIGKVDLITSEVEVVKPVPMRFKAMPPNGSSNCGAAIAA